MSLKYSMWRLIIDDYKSDCDIPYNVIYRVCLTVLSCWYVSKFFVEKANDIAESASADGCANKRKKGVEREEEKEKDFVDGLSAVAYLVH